jgi:tetratricopeptide (TPR) repeat protein
LAKTGKKKRVTVKQMRFRNDPMIRFYETTQEWLQERGRPVVLVVGVLVGAVLLYTAGYYFFNYRSNKAKVAYAEALEKYNTPVVTESITTNPSQFGKTYQDQNTKWQETAEAFERVASEHSSFEAKARYMAGISYLHLDRDKGLQILQQAADRNEQPTSDLARLAIAEAWATGGNTQGAVAEYEKLLGSPNVAKEAVQLGLAHAYEKVGEKEKAIALYVEVASNARTSAAGSDAEKRLSALAPERIKDLPPPNQGAPVGRQ